MSMKAMIIEDEPHALEGLKRLISKHSDILQLVGAATDGKQGVQMIEQIKPDVIFLDINIPVFNGFELLNQISYLPNVIFTSAYNEYAVKAFEANAVDYLLKPIEPERFIQAVNRLNPLRKANSFAQEQQMQQMLKDYFAEKEFSSISIKLNNRVIFVHLDEITHFYAEDKYVMVNNLDSVKHITSFTIHDLERRLPSRFIRISRAVVVNKHHIREARKQFGKSYEIILSDKNSSIVETGSKYVDNFLRVLN